MDDGVRVRKGISPFIHSILTPWSVVVVKVGRGGKNGVRVWGRMA